jgi:uncharacterized repeat protein (TIGR04076 family)
MPLSASFSQQVPLELTYGLTISGNPMPNDEFELWDLRIEVIGNQQEMVCDHTVGDYFELSGENLSFPTGRPFSLYALAAILPLLPAKQRKTHANDWMTTDAEIACPDPHCGARFRITRIGKTVFRHSETTAEPLPPGPED